MGTDIPKIHWFQEAKTRKLFAVIGPGHLLLSPDLVSEHIKASPLAQQAVIAYLCGIKDKATVFVLVDLAVQMEGNVQAILESLPSSISERISGFNFVGVASLADNDLHLQLVEQGEFRRRRTKSMMESVEELSPLDSTGRSLLALKAKKDYSDQDFFRAIEHDSALCAQLLNWGTSAFYGSSIIAPTVESVVIRNLGLDKALVLSIGLSVQKAFQIEKDLKPALVDNITESIFVSNVARAVSSRVFEPHDKNLIPLCGMLYNLGDLVLMQVSPSSYRTYARYKAFNPAHTQEFIQRVSLGFECSQMGVILATRWDLPACVTGVIGCGQLGSEPVDKKPVESRVIVLSQRLLADEGQIAKEYVGEIEPRNMGLDNNAVGLLMQDFNAKRAYYEMIAQAMAA